MNGGFSIMDNTKENIEFDFDIDCSNTDIETTCLKCGYTELVPDFIYDEMSRKKYHFKIKKKVSTLTCQKCGKEAAIPSNLLKNKS